MRSIRNDWLKWLKIALFFSSIVSWNTATGQHFFFRRYTIEEGLLSSDNYQTIQDKSGYIWICSKNGIVCYNGYTFKTFTTNNGLPINDIWELYCDSKNRIWIRAFTKGTYYIEHGKVKHIKAAKKISNLLVSQEYKDTLFFVESFAKNKIGKQRYFLAENGTFGNYRDFSYKDMYVSGDFRKYNILLYEATLSNPKRSNMHFKLLNAGKVVSKKSYYKIGNVLLPGECSNVFTSELNNYDSLLIISKNKLNYIDSRAHFGGKVTHLKQVAYPYEYVVVVDGKCRYYKNILTKERAFKYENRINQLYKNVGTNWNLLIDKESNLWFTLTRGEIIFVPALTEFVTFYDIFHNGIHEQGIQSMYNFENQLVLITNGKKAFYFDKVTKSFTQETFEADHYFRIVINKFTKDWYLLGEKNIVKLSKYGAIKKTQTIHNHQKKFIKHFVWLSENEALFNNGQLYKLKNGSLSLLKMSFQFTDKVEEIFVFNGHYILRTPYSLVIYNPQTKSIVKTLEECEINVIYRDGNTLLLGTNGRGLLQLDAHFSLTYLGLKACVINDLKGNKDHYYVATNKGLYVLDYVGKQVLRIWTKYDGLASTEINAICLDSQKLYLGTKSGLNSILLSKIVAKVKMASVLKLERLFINEQKTSFLGKNKFAYNENNLKFQFEALSFSTMGLTNFKYKLRGYDKEWKYSNVRTIVYNNLFPGKYKLVIYALNKDNKIISNPLEYKLVVTPHFFQTLFAKYLISLLLLVAVFYLVFLISKFSNKRIQRKQYLTQLELKALRAQLNPHFVFNSLNSLQSILILKGEKEANKHLHAFSGLMRKVLDNSKNETISLSDEIDFLTNYLILEKNRISSSIQFDITYDGLVNPAEIWLPVMIFQPIVENSIVHGLVNKTGDKRLKISFTLNDKQLIVVIEDNGIGRSKSEMINKKQTHKSWSSTILREKMNVFNQIKNNTIKFEMIDLIDANNVACGTKVIVFLKIDFLNKLNR